MSRKVGNMKILGPSKPIPKLEHFGDVELPNDDGWKVLRNAFKSNNPSTVVSLLEASGNEPVPTSLIPRFSRGVLGGMNGASVYPGLPYRLALVYKDKPFEENAVVFVRKGHKPSDPRRLGKGMVCS